MKIVVGARPHVHQAETSSTTQGAIAVDQLVKPLGLECIKCRRLCLVQHLFEVDALLVGNHIA